MFDEETENLVRDMDNNLRMQGLDLSTYLKYTGMELDAVKAEMRPRAINQVKTRLALEKIAEIENIEATDEDINEELDKISKAYGVELEEVKKMVPAGGIEEDVKVRKAVEFVKSAAKITEKSAEKKETAKKPAAKKPAAKKAAAKPKAEKSEDGAKEEKKAPAKNASTKTKATKPAAEKAETKETAPQKTTAKKAPAKKTTAKSADKKDEATSD